MSLTHNRTPGGLTRTLEPGVVYQHGEVTVRYEQGVGRLPGLFAAKVAGQPAGWAPTYSGAVTIANRRMSELLAARSAMRQVDVFTDEERRVGADTAVVIAPLEPELVAEVGAAYVRQMPAVERLRLWAEVTLRFQSARLASTREQMLESLRRPWVTEVHDA